MLMFLLVVSQGLQAAECLHSCSGTTSGNCERLLEDDLGVQEQGHCDAMQPRGRWSG